MMATTRPITQTRIPIPVTGANRKTKPAIPATTLRTRQTRDELALAKELSLTAHLRRICFGDGGSGWHPSSEAKRPTAAFGEFPSNAGRKNTGRGSGASSRPWYCLLHHLENGMG